MELSLSSEAQEAIRKIKRITSGSAKKTNGIDVLNSFSTLNSDEKIMDSSEIINVDEINFSNDETWLYESSVKTKSKNIADLKKWLYDNSSKIVFDANFLSAAIASKCQSIKNNIDSRTFTRPKKKISRQSLEDYYGSFNLEEKESLQKLNENFVTEIKDKIDSIFKTDEIEEEEDNINFEVDTDVDVQSIATDKSSISPRPINFNFNEPVKSNIFDKVFTASQGVDSFINMSPPSLVNSLCSSTFTNLMENSYIKNDPVLREIRDTDYSEILLQDSESPMFFSITESCSSLMSDTPENLVQKYSESFLNTTVKRNPQNTSITNDLHKSQESNFNILDEIESNFNDTYRKDDDENEKTLCQESVDQTSFSDISIIENKEKFDNKFLDDREYLFGKDVTNVLSGSTAHESVNSKNAINTGTFVRNKTLVDNVTFNTNTYRKSSSLQHNNTFRKNSGPCLNSTFQKAPSDEQLENEDIMNRTVVLESHNSTVVLSNDNIVDDDTTTETRRYSYVIDDCDQKYHPLVSNNINKKGDSVGPFGGSEDSLDRMSSLSSSSKGSNRMLNMAEVDAIVQQQEKSLQDISTPKVNTLHMKQIWDGDGLSPISSTMKQRTLTASDSEIEKGDYLTATASNTKLLSLGSDTSLLAARSRLRLNAATMASNCNPRDENSQPNTARSNHNLQASRSNFENVPAYIKRSYTNLNPTCANVITAAVKSKTTSDHQMNVTKIIDSHVTNKDENLLLSRNVLTQPSTKSNQVKRSGLPRPVSMYGTGIPRPVSKIPAPRSNRPMTTRSVPR